MTADATFCQYLSRIGSMGNQKGVLDGHVYAGSETMDGLDQALVAWSRADPDSERARESDTREICVRYVNAEIRQ
jgi:hypothetical protein